MEASTKIRRRSFVLLLALFGVLVAGCGSSSTSSSPAPDYAKDLKSAPAPLAALYQQTDYGKTPTVVPGGLAALQSQVAKLKGNAVVVNVWASWCLPCRQEFSNFQKASAKFGDQVAFLGDDSGDYASAAKPFLADNAVPYPSFDDHDEDAKSTYHLVGYPDTIFFDKTGKVVYTHQGPYTSEADLAADIKRYAL